MFRERRGGFGGFRGGGFRGRRESDNLPKPVELGKEYDVEIAEVGSRGDGIARISNFVIFVPNTKQGDKVRVKINSLGRSFAVAEKVGEAPALEETEKGTEAGEESVAEETAEEASAEEEPAKELEEIKEAVEEEAEAKETVEEETAEEAENLETEEETK